MASIILSAAGSAVVGGAAANPFLAFLGSQVGSQIGGKVDDFVFGPLTISSQKGGRLQDLSVQTSTYGRSIPVAYGNARIAGNILWSRPIKEVVTTSTSSAGGGKGGGGKISSTQTSYAYYATLAIAICEGEVDEVLRVWADAGVVDVANSSVTYRVYKGDDLQLPDPLIESFEGVGKVPAYRGIAYIMVEDFPLEAYGNRIPNFTFEIKKKALLPDSSGNILENMIESMVLIPGSGEYVYDTQIEYKISGEVVGANFIQNGKKERINQHNREDKANVLLALDQLEQTCPNVEWISLVVTWFGDDLNARNCTINPGVEYKVGATTDPDIWGVGGFTRSTARQITIDVNGSPVYGGTPDDDSVLRLLTELRARGYKILFYPMFFMDVANKPWRGRVTGSVTEVSNFFTKTNGYNAFITHYANLVLGKVDGFVIGSELIGLTKVKNGSNQFPAVDKLVTLAATVKGILGSGVKVTYAADWSEYHHTDGGWYNLDPLWASPNIDVIGIDAYFPLTDETQTEYDLEKVIHGWTSGEGYDFYYTDDARTTKASLGAAYAWKNIAWWWSHSHVNPDSTTSAWVPESKKIWFTEYGFPSVDGATNQPNVFYDPNSSESYFPRFSKGRIDFRAQRLGLLATEKQWKDSAMIERKFIWTWDARPFPYWPDLTRVWADGPLWKTGHWVQGKLGLSTLGAIVADLCRRVGLGDMDFDTSRLLDLVEGFIITNRTSARKVIEDLQKAYFFDPVESDGIIKFTGRSGTVVKEISQDEIISSDKSGSTELVAIVRKQELELPSRVEINYFNRLADYQVGTQRSERQVSSSKDSVEINLPLVMPDQEAKTVADISLFNAWQERTGYRFDLPYRYALLEPTDVIRIIVNSAEHTLRITDTHYGKPGIVRISGVAEDAAVYDFYTAPAAVSPQIQAVTGSGLTHIAFLDLPAFPSDGEAEAKLRFAAGGEEMNWSGAVIYRSDDAGGSYAHIAGIEHEAVVGNAIDVLAGGTTTTFDKANTVTIVLKSGELSGANELGVLNGANTAVLGEEVLQFQTATLIAPNKYVLSNLLRGRLGTEYTVSSHVAGERFVLLDASLAAMLMPTGLFGLSRLYKPVSIGMTLGQTDSTNFTYQGKALRPYAPVHLAAARDGSGNITITWIRRSRVGGEWRDAVDIALAEATEAYEVEILSGSTVVRTISSISSPLVTYSDSQQIADFGSVQSSVSVRIYQMSSAIGRGIAATATL